MSIEIRKITKESMMILIAGMSVFATALLLKYSVIPAVNQMYENIDNYSRIKTMITSENGLTNVINDIRIRNSKIKKKLEPYSGVSIEKTGDLSGFLEHLIKCANASDVKFVKIEPGVERFEAGALLYPVTLQFTSAYDALGRFVNTVEKNPHMYRVEGLFVEARGQGRVEAKIGITCIAPAKEK